jgi:hypothetical protein
MKRFMITACAVAAVLILNGAARADWNAGDDCKMHYPQLPNPNGWDICLNHQFIADDFQCTETGPITDVHFWVSWKDDNARWDLIQNIGLNFYANCSGGTSENKPGGILRAYNISPSDPEYSYRSAGSGLQGWHCPSPPPYTNEFDHQNYYQINLKPLDGPWFYQEQGTTYWLGLNITMLPDATPSNPADDPQIGWKTTLSLPFGGHSKWSEGEPVMWNLVQPLGQKVNQAFVITGVPEPGTLMLLLTAGLGALCYAWRRRRS